MISNNIKRLIKGGSLVLPLILLIFFNDTTARSVSGALSNELAKAPITTPATPIIAGPLSTSVTTNEYVQSEAHMQIDEVKEKMGKFNLRVPNDPNPPKRPLTPNQAVTSYLNLIAAILNKEVEFKNGYCVFYQATSNRWRVPQDLFKKLFIHYKKSASQLDDFEFVRFTDAKSIKAQDFLNENIAQWGGVNDNIGEVRDVVMSVNLALFGNVGFPGECTWNYFLENKSHRWPIASNYYEVLKSFDITYDIELLAQETLKLSEMLDAAAPEQTIFQFFIPHNIVDDVAYLAWLLGFPAHQKSIELMEKVLEGKPMVGAFTGPAVKGVMKKFKKDPNNAIYKELAQLAAEGKFGVRGFADQLCTDPFAMENVNETQARLLVTNDAFKNPASGIKIFTYFTTPSNIQQQYTQQLNALAQKIIAQESNKSAQQKEADRSKNEAIFARLKEEQAAQMAAEKATKKTEKAEIAKKAAQAQKK